MAKKSRYYVCFLTFTGRGHLVDQNFTYSCTILDKQPKSTSGTRLEDGHVSEPLRRSKWLMNESGEEKMFGKHRGG